MKSSEEDLLLVEQAKSGNQQAFTRLFDKYKDSIQYFVYRRVRNATTAEDLTIEIFSKAFCKIDTYGIVAGATFRTWLYQIARNHCIDFIKAKYNKPDLISTTEEQTKIISTVVDSKYANPEQILISEQETDKILKHIKTLNPSYAKAFNYYSFKDMSYEEIAKELGTTISSVAGKVRLARKALSNKLNINKKR